MTVTKLIFETAACPDNKPATIRNAFTDIRLSHGMKQKPGSAEPSMDKVPVDEVHRGVIIRDQTLADRQAAEALIAMKVEAGGPALAVRFAQPDPVTGLRIDPATNERRTEWLFGAKLGPEQLKPGQPMK